MRRYMVAGAAFVLLSAACGQYPGVHEEAYGSGTSGLGPAGTNVPSPTATTGGGTTGLGTSGTGTTGTGTTGTGTTGTGTTDGSTGGGDGGGDGGTPSAPTGGDSTGVTPTSITIGLHAPLTRAAPIKAASFQEGKDLFWLRGNNGRPVKIYGRQVRVLFQDDHYNPSYARTVCQQMAEQDGAFLLIGGGGTDQIQACAQYAASQGVPYLSAGVTEIGLGELPNYFALSMSYPQQIPLMADYIRKNLRPQNLAAVVTDTSNFDDALEVFLQEFPDATIIRPGKNEPGESYGTRLCLEGYDVVFPLTSPRFYLEMAGSARCRPQYIGVGITMGLNEVANLGCRAGESTEGARFFSPAPAFADSDRYDPQFRNAGGDDDIEWLLWGLSKTLHQLFVKAGQNLTREGFIAATSNATVNNDAFPDLRYTPSDHFGASQVNLLRNVCEGTRGGEYVTEAAFATGF